MKAYFKSTIAAAAIAVAALGISAPAEAGVHIGLSVGVPGYYYGPGYYPPGPCDAYNSYYNGDCGYSVYDGPIYLDGAYVTGPHYYRWYGGEPMFWYRGGWHHWNGWRNVHNYRWNYNEGWGWHGGRWDRDYGRAHWHAMNQDRREYRNDRRDTRGDVHDLRYDRNHGASAGELRHDRREIRQDRREMRGDRRDIRDDRHHH
ncbi:MAG TPA: hypothetical protein VGH02_05215 [Rhizomicrobium sp.]